jgi:hypothetical protein
LNPRALRGRSNTTFREMLIEEYRDQGQPRDCHVYYTQATGGYYYYFSPTAAMVLEGFMRFREGFGVSEPTNLAQMEIVI